MPQPSPRTESEPMAFTPDEFLRGTVAAWLWFNVLFAGSTSALQLWTASDAWGTWWSGLALVLMYFAPVAIVASGIVTLACCSAAWWLGHLLRRRRSVVLHAICFALLGWTIGAVVVAVYLLAVRAPFSLADGFPLLIQACSGAAVALGWAWTVRHCLRVEQGRTRRRRADVDAVYEDAL